MKRMQSTKGRADYSEVIVRPARKNDAAALGAFITLAWKEAGPGALGFTGATDDAIKTISSTEFLTRRLSRPNVRIIIAERGREILGFASILATEKGEGELTGVVVLKNASGTGLGSRLVRKACEAAARLGLKRLFVKTEAFNQRAIEFYKKNEFTISGKVTEKVGRVNVPLMVMERELRRRAGPKTV